jgi:hypothetical protein
MKLVPVFLLLCILISSSCKNNKPAAPAAVKKVEDTARFYPLKDFLKEQIQYVDLRSFPIYKVTIKDGKKDSVSLTKDQFIQQAGIFLNWESSFSKTKANYTESVFNDLSTGSITFNYQSTNANTEVQNIDILLDEQTHIVKRVFIRSVYNKGDTAVMEQCNWKADKSFQVNRTFSTRNGYTSTERNYINWNDKP